MIQPAIQGTLHVLRACTKAQTVKRVILTSSAAAVSVNKLTDTDLVMDEECWTDVESLYSEKPPTWVMHVLVESVSIALPSIVYNFEHLQGYLVSKTLAEKAAWKFAEENQMDLVSVIPSLMAGPSLTPIVPSSICLAMSLLTGSLQIT